MGDSVGCKSGERGTCSCVLLVPVPLSRRYWQESFDGESFVSQSRFDAYAIGRNPSMVNPWLANQDLMPMLCLLASRNVQRLSYYQALPI